MVVTMVTEKKSSEILHEVRKQTIRKYNFMLFTTNTNI